MRYIDALEDLYDVLVGAPRMVELSLSWWILRHCSVSTTMSKQLTGSYSLSTLLGS